MNKMRKRKNISKYTLRKISFATMKAKGGRNIAAIIAMILTCILFTCIFTVTSGIVESFQNDIMRQTSNSAHGAFVYINDEEYDVIKKDKSIKEIGYLKIISAGVQYENQEESNKALVYMDNEAQNFTFSHIIAGKMPTNFFEIATDTKTLNQFGIPHKIGEKITLSYMIKDEIFTQQFTLSGYWESYPLSSTSFINVSKVFLENNNTNLTYTYDKDKDSSGVIHAYVSFDNAFSIDKKLQKIMNINKLSNVNCNVNPAFLFSEFAGGPAPLIVLGIGLLLIIITGYLIIYNIYNISVKNDIQYYGLMKTLGTSKSQIRYIILLDGTIISCISIPIGLITGFFIGKFLLKLIISFADINSTAVTLNPFILLGATLFSVLTMMVGLMKPIQIAKKVSPIAALNHL